MQNNNTNHNSINHNNINNTITMLGWQEGLEEIKLTLLQTSMLDISLQDAKKNVENLLKDNIVNIFTSDFNKAVNFTKQAKKIGAFCTIS